MTTLRANLKSLLEPGIQVRFPKLRKQKVSFPSISKGFKPFKIPGTKIKQIKIPV